MSLGIFILIGIIVIALVLYFYGSNANQDNVPKPESVSKVEKKSETSSIEEEFLYEDGRKYRILTLTREVPRKTYILGDLSGKYWGEIDTKNTTEYYKFFDFNIYECTVTNTETSKTIPYFLEDSNNFPRERLPKLLPIIVQKDGKEYALNIHEPQIGSVKFNRRLHQDEGAEVFGTIDAKVTGYVLDFIKEEYEVIEYVKNSNQPIVENPPTSKLYKTLTPTGEIQKEGNYKRIEYYFSDYKSKYWGDWKYIKPAGEPVGAEGCLPSVLGLLGTIIAIGVVVLLLPSIIFILPFILIPILFSIIPSAAWNWIFRILAVILLLGFIISLFYTFKHSSSSYVPKPVVQERLEEQKPQYNPIIDTLNDTPKTDTLITHFRTWKDYDGNTYEGKFWVRNSAFVNAHNFKNNLSITGNTENNYDYIVFSLKENDKQNLGGIYQLFDSIRNAKKQTVDKFAETIVSFIQDIPYTVVLTDDCDPNLYADDFIRKYLSSENARCDGNEKFGINTPVEFLATLKGDCDTRTLLLYTILAHYGYDVTMMSSEYYNHSLIGINLPYDGLAFNYSNQRYVLWETTSINFKPGILPNEISNINYWRISLKSK